jgi:hypothetical protein
MQVNFDKDALSYNNFELVLLIKGEPSFYDFNRMQVYNVDEEQKLIKTCQQDYWVEFLSLKEPIMYMSHFNYLDEASPFNIVLRLDWDEDLDENTTTISCPGQVPARILETLITINKELRVYKSKYAFLSKKRSLLKKLEGEFPEIDWKLFFDDIKEEKHVKDVTERLFPELYKVKKDKVKLLASVKSFTMGRK